MPSKTPFITGASSGNGEATARAGVAGGWNVGPFVRSTDKITTLADELGDAALALPGDVTEYDAQISALQTLADRYGQVDAVFANAGRGVIKAGAEGGDLDDWDSLAALNIMGLLKTVKAALPHLKPLKGHLVLTGLAAGRVHLSGSFYGATKWFVHSFGGNLAEEMNDWGSHCTVVAPGLVNTSFFDDPKPGKLKADDMDYAAMHSLCAPSRNSVRETYLMPTE